MTARTRNYLWLAGALIAVWLYGAIHVVYGDGLGVGTCWKQGWSMSDTFVDWGEKIDRTPDKVLAALAKCKLVPDAGAWPRDRDIMIVVVLALLGWIGAKAYQGAFGSREDERK